MHPVLDFIRKLRTDREFILKMGTCIYIPYSLITIFSYVAYQFFNLAQIPPFLGSLENVWFGLAWSILLSNSDVKPRRDRLETVILVLTLSGGATMLVGGLLWLIRGGGIAVILLIAAWVLVVFQASRRLYLRFRERIRRV